MDIRLGPRIRIKKDLIFPYKGRTTINVPKDSVGRILKSSDEVDEHYREQVEMSFDLASVNRGVVVEIDWQIFVLKRDDFELEDDDYEENELENDDPPPEVY